MQVVFVYCVWKGLRDCLLDITDVAEQKDKQDMIEEKKVLDT